MTKGCLIIHGLTGTPATVAIIKEKLVAAGFKVAAPCLAGHGGSVEELSQSTRQQWYDTVHEAYLALRRDTDKIYFAGISLGALLGLRLAIEEGWGVRALALLATPLTLPPTANFLLNLVRYSPLRAIVKEVPKDSDKSIADPEGQRLYREFSLPSIPVRSVCEISDLQKELLLRLGRLTNPLMLLHGAGDKVALPSNVELLKKLVSSDIVETRIFEKSRHVLTMDYDREEVANAVVDFFHRFA